MQTLISSQQASQLCGTAVNLLQAAAGHLRSLSATPLSTPISRQTRPGRPAAQLLAHTVSHSQPRTLPGLRYSRPFNAPTARSTLVAPHLNSIITTRSFHSTHGQLPKISRRWRNPCVSRSSSPLLLPRRNVSLFSQQPTPQPHVLAALHLLESAANIAPTDTSAQVTYYKALVESGIPRALERLTSRWERMLEFDKTNPVLRSPEAFQLYLSALVRSDPRASVDQAAKRRDQVLEATSSTAPALNSDNSNTSPAFMSESRPQVDASTDGPPQSSVSTSPSEVPSLPLQTSIPQASQMASQPPSSQQLARSVLALHASPSSSSGLFRNAAGWLGGNTAFPFTNTLSAAGGGGNRDNPIYVTVAEPKGMMGYRILRFLTFTFLGAAFTFTILSVVVENIGLIKEGPKTTEFEPVEGKIVKFSDVHGVDEAKDELQEIVAFLKDPSSFSALGGKLPKGVLLTGPPGTGKTLLARAVAGEAGVPFLFASGSEFDEMFVGVGAKRIRELFAAARKRQPAIIFIDELDAIGSKRSPRDQHYVKQTLNQLLVEMDGFQQTEGVIVIGATNFPQSLDQALVRPGRFDRKISVPLPDVKGRVQILQHHMRNVITSEDVDPAVLARGTPGFSGADLENMVNQAAVKASRDGCQSILLNHFEWAKDRIIMGAERRSTYIAPKVKKLTAYHEGGHALVALYTDGAMPLHKVTCMPRGDSLGHTSQLPEDDRYSVSFKEFVAEMDVCMGGRIAEELIYGTENTTSGCYSDLAYATDVASRLVQFYGFSTKLGPVFLSDNAPMSAHTRQEIESEVRTLLEASQERARQILIERQEELHRLADALMEYETLNLEEVMKVIKGEPIREYEKLEEIEV